jgi:hypothetical protein
MCWNPDNNAIPLLTSMGDLLGTSLLALAFLVHCRLFPEYGQRLDQEVLGGANWTTAGPMASASPSIVQTLLRMQGVDEESWDWTGTGGGGGNGTTEAMAQ